MGKRGDPSSLIPESKLRGLIARPESLTHEREPGRA